MKLKDKVVLPFGETGTIVKILDIPWGFKYIVRIRKGVFHKTNQLLEFKREQLKLEGSIISPKKHFLGRDELWCDWYKCPNCKDRNIRYKDNYCVNCGIKFEWVDLNTFSCDAGEDNKCAIQCIDCKNFEEE